MKLVQAALTILRGCHIHNTDRMRDTIGSFEDWSEQIRAAVIWVGKQGYLDVDDPGKTIKQTTEEDEETQLLGAVLEHWHGILRNEPVTVGQAVQHFDNAFLSNRKLGKHASAIRPLLEDICGEGDNLNNKKLGQWLKSQEDRIVNDYKLEIASRASGQIHWRVVKVHDK